MKTSEEVCAKKKTYDGVFEAVRAGEPRGLGAYQCNVCNKWHLTSRKSVHETDEG